MQSRHCKREREREQHYKKRRKVQGERRRAVCLNPVGFPSVRFTALLSEPYAGQCRRVCASVAPVVLNSAHW